MDRNNPVFRAIPPSLQTIQRRYNGLNHYCLYYHSARPTDILRNSMTSSWMNSFIFRLGLRLWEHALKLGAEIVAHQLCYYCSYTCSLLN